FVLDQRLAPAGSLDLALFTAVRDRNPPPGASAQPPARSARLERAVLEPAGRLQADRAVNLKAPLEGPPTLECGMFVEVPSGSVHVGHCWGAQEEGRPQRMWTLAGTEMFG